MTERETVAVVMPHGIEALLCTEIAARQARGMAKYGTSVANNPLSLRQWLQHAMEEALDQAVYLRRAIAELDAQAGEALRICVLVNAAGEAVSVTRQDGAGLVKSVVWQRPAAFEEGPFRTVFEERPHG